MDSAADLPKITQALMARGYSAEDMNKILGGNFLRVFAKVQEVSRQLQSENRPRITRKAAFRQEVAASNSAAGVLVCLGNHP